MVRVWTRRQINITVGTGMYFSKGTLAFHYEIGNIQVDNYF